MPSIYNWSTSAASNANADGDINWAEGQAPSTVNNSARVMMQRVRELMNDLGGAIVTGGSANVLTMAAGSAFNAYADGIRVSFRAAASNTGAATLNVNAIGAKPVVKFTSSGETALSAGEIQANCIYEAIYSTILNGAAGAWLLLNPTEQAVKPGLIEMCGMSTAPDGYLKCNGAAVSRTTYAALFTAIGTTWGAGNGTTTFNVPDLRGEFIRGWDDGRNVDTGRAFASAQAQAIQSHTHTGTTELAGAHSHEYGRGDPGGGSPLSAAFGAGNTFANGLTSSAPQHTHPFTTEATGGTETRPRNRAILFVIKT